MKDLKGSCSIAKNNKAKTWKGYGATDDTCRKNYPFSDGAHGVAYGASKRRFFKRQKVFPI